MKYFVDFHSSKVQIETGLMHSWELNGTRWYPEYSQELGRPTSPSGAGARVKGKRWKYTRSFESGTMVKVDVATRVEWWRYIYNIYYNILFYLFIYTFTYVSTCVLFEHWNTAKTLY